MLASCAARESPTRRSVSPSAPKSSRSVTSAPPDRARTAPTRPSRAAEAAASAARGVGLRAKRSGARLRDGTGRFGGRRHGGGLDCGIAEPAGLGLELVDERRDPGRLGLACGDVGLRGLHLVPGRIVLGGRPDRRARRASRSARPRPPSPSIRRAQYPLRAPRVYPRRHSAVARTRSVHSPGCTRSEPPRCR